MKKIIYLISLFLIHNCPTSNAQNPCRYQNSLSLSTGLNSSGALGTVGSYDANWVLNDGPTSFGIIFPQPMYIIPNNWLGTWNWTCGGTHSSPGVNFIGSNYISPINSTSYGIDNCPAASGPNLTKEFRVKKTFCLNKSTTIDMNIKVAADDIEYLYLDGSLLASGNLCGYNWTVLNSIIYTGTFPLSGGVHTVEIGLRNCGGSMMGIDVEGTLTTVDGSLSLGQGYCCSNTGIIAGVKYNDNNHNGIRESAEALLPGWTIELKDATGATTLATQITGPAGQYSFGALAPGTYMVCEVQQIGWVQSQPASPVCYTIVVIPGGIVQAEFGNYNSPCICGQWGTTKYTLNNKDYDFSCNNGGTTVIQANQGDIISVHPNFICSGGTIAAPCNATYKYDIYYPGGASLLNQTSLAAFKLDACGINRIVMTPYCDGKPCTPCEFSINVNCCNCNPDLTPMLSWQTANGSESLKLNCNETYTNKLDCFKDYTISIKNPCGADCKPDEVITTITYPNGTSSTSTSVFGATLSTGSLTGTFTVSIKVKCNGVWCKECKLTFIQTKACPPPCDNCKNQNGTPKVQASFSSGQSSLNVHTFPAATTLSAAILLGAGTDTYTQIRLNVLDIQVSSDNPACLQCYNTPNQWGSILGGSLSIGGFTTTSSTYGTISTGNLNNNSREIIFDAATPTTIPMATAVNLNIQLPGVSPISCCCIKIKLFVKVTYRNNKCEECSRVVLIDMKECPGENGGIGTFVPDGHPQYKIASPNKDANQPVKFTNGDKINNR